MTKKIEIDYDLSENETLGGDYGVSSLWKVIFGDLSLFKSVRETIYIVAVDVRHAIVLSRVYAEIIEGNDDSVTIDNSLYLGGQILSIKQIAPFVISDPRFVVDRILRIGCKDCSTDNPDLESPTA